MNIHAFHHAGIEDASQPHLAIRTVEDEPYAPRPEALGWAVLVVIPTPVGTATVAHVVGHDQRFIVGVRA